MRAEAWPRVRSCQGWGRRALWDAAPLARHPTMAHPPARPPGIGVGTWAWGNQFLWGYDPSQDPMLEATFAAAVAAGLCTFDTADSYGTGRFNGRSEALLGRFVAALPPARRESLCVATKLAPFPWRLGRQGYQRAFEASKHRLGGRVDLVQLHWSTARYAPWQEDPLLEGLADLVQQGEVAALGVSNMGPRRLRSVHRRLAERGVPPVSDPPVKRWYAPAAAANATAVTRMKVAPPREREAPAVRSERLLWLASAMRGISRLGLSVRRGATGPEHRSCGRTRARRTE